MMIANRTAALAFRRSRQTVTNAPHYYRSYSLTAPATTSSSAAASDASSSPPRVQSSKPPKNVYMWGTSKKGTIPTNLLQEATESSAGMFSGDEKIVDHPMRLDLEKGALNGYLFGEDKGKSGGDDDDDDGDWLVSHILTAEEQRKREEKALEEEFDILDGEGEVVEKLGQVSISGEQGKSSEKKDAAGATAAADGEDDDEYADMADFEDDDVMADEAAVTAAPSVPSTTDAANENENILKVRSYDISITYDKYYQTPRVWLMGYADDGSNRPLTGDEMMQDVISDYAHRTVTVENHPHVSGPHASIHPCQHGAVMKTIVKNLTRDSSEKEEDGSGGSDGPSVDMYIFIFLKFVSSMIPTINYDFTMDVSASTKK
mmetsp:Transcript_18041/g.31749  ORF Transcript_18041/g.31749 Transcript_18041/m.31749 type:complete len:375 (+) Transcript_18041:91-1215(+)